MRRAQRLGQQQNRGGNRRNPAFPSLTALLGRPLHHEVIACVACLDLLNSIKLPLSFRLVKRGRAKLPRPAGPFPRESFA